MRTAAFLILAAALHGQSFDVASVKTSAKTVGPDYNNQVTFGPSSFTGKNVTLKRLVVEAYGVDPPQVFGGPKWLGEAEYDIEAKAGQPAAKEQLRKMLQPLLAARFHLVIHRETRELKGYEMVIDKGGPKIKPVKEGEGRITPLGSPHFHGELGELAGLISVQLSIPMIDDPTRPAVASGGPAPVFNKTGLSGTYDFDIERRPEFGADPFNMWQHVLQDRLGLKLQSTKGPVEGIVVDSADRTPVEN